MALSLHDQEEVDAITHINMELVEAFEALQHSNLAMEAEYKCQVALLRNELKELNRELHTLRAENEQLKARVANDVLRERQTKRIEVAHEKANMASRVRRAGMRYLENTEGRLMETHDDMYHLIRFDAMAMPMRNVTFVTHYTHGLRVTPFDDVQQRALCTARQVFFDAARETNGYHLCSVLCVEVFAFHSPSAALEFARKCHVMLLSVPWTADVTSYAEFSCVPRLRADVVHAKRSSARHWNRSRIASAGGGPVDVESGSAGSSERPCSSVVHPAFPPDADGESGLYLFAGPRLRTCVFHCNPGAEVDPLTGDTVYFGQELRDMYTATFSDVRVGEIGVNEAWVAAFCAEQRVLRDDDTTPFQADAERLRQLLASGSGSRPREDCGTYPPSHRHAVGGSEWDIAGRCSSRVNGVVFALLPPGLTERRLWQPPPVSLAVEKRSLFSAAGEESHPMALPNASHGAEAGISPSETSTVAPFLSVEAAVEVLSASMKGVVSYSSNYCTLRQHSPGSPTSASPRFRSSALLSNWQKSQSLVRTANRRCRLMQTICESLEEAAMLREDRYVAWQSRQKITATEAVFVCTLDLLEEDVWRMQLQNFHAHRHQVNALRFSESPKSHSPQEQLMAQRAASARGDGSHRLTKMEMRPMEPSSQIDVELHSSAVDVASGELGEDALVWNREVLMELREALRDIVQACAAECQGFGVNGNNEDIFCYAFRTPEQSLAFASRAYESVIAHCKRLFGVPERAPGGHSRDNTEGRVANTGGSHEATDASAVRKQRSSSRPQAGKPLQKTPIAPRPPVASGPAAREAPKGGDAKYLSAPSQGDAAEHFFFLLRGGITLGPIGELVAEEPSGVVPRTVIASSPSVMHSKSQSSPGKHGAVGDGAAHRSYNGWPIHPRQSRCAVAACSPSEEASAGVGTEYETDDNDPFSAASGDDAARRPHSGERLSCRARLLDRGSSRPKDMEGKSSGRYNGPAVRASARLCDSAKPGDLLVAGDVVARFYASKENITNGLYHIVKHTKGADLLSLATDSISQATLVADRQVSMDMGQDIHNKASALQVSFASSCGAASAALRYSHMVGTTDMGSIGNHEWSTPADDFVSPSTSVLLATARRRGFGANDTYSLLPRRYAYRRKLTQAAMIAENRLSKSQVALNVKASMPSLSLVDPWSADAAASKPQGARQRKSAVYSALNASLPLSVLYATPLRSVRFAFQPRQCVFSRDHVRLLLAAMQQRVELSEAMMMAEHDAYLVGEVTRSGPSLLAPAAQCCVSERLPESITTAAGGPSLSLSSATACASTSLSRIAAMSGVDHRYSLVSRGVIGYNDLLLSAAAQHPLRPHGFLLFDVPDWDHLAKEIQRQHEEDPQRRERHDVGSNTPTTRSSLSWAYAQEQLALLQQHVQYVVCSACRDQQGFPFRFRGQRSILAHFPDPHRALEAAVQIQLRLLHTPWPDEVTVLDSALRVRSPKTGQLLFSGPRARIAVHCARCEVQRGAATMSMEDGGVATLLPTALKPGQSALLSSITSQQYYQKRDGGGIDTADTVVMILDQHPTNTSRWDDRRATHSMSLLTAAFYGNGIDTIMELGDQAIAGEIVVSQTALAHLSNSNGSCFYDPTEAAEEMGRQIVDFWAASRKTLLKSLVYERRVLRERHVSGADSDGSQRVVRRSVSSAMAKTMFHITDQPSTGGAHRSAVHESPRYSTTFASPKVANMEIPAEKRESKFAISGLGLLGDDEASNALGDGSDGLSDHGEEASSQALRVLHGNVDSGAPRCGTSQRRLTAFRAKLKAEEQSWSSEEACFTVLPAHLAERLTLLRLWKERVQRETSEAESLAAVTATAERCAASMPAKTSISAASPRLSMDLLASGSQRSGVGSRKGRGAKRFSTSSGSQRPASAAESMALQTVDGNAWLPVSATYSEQDGALVFNFPAPSVLTPWVPSLLHPMLYRWYENRSLLPSFTPSRTAGVERVPPGIMCIDMPHKSCSQTACTVASLACDGEQSIQAVERSSSTQSTAEQQSHSTATLAMRMTHGSLSEPGPVLSDVACASITACLDGVISLIRSVVHRATLRLELLSTPWEVLAEANWSKKSSLTSRSRASRATSVALPSTMSSMGSRDRATVERTSTEVFTLSSTGSVKAIESLTNGLSNGAVSPQWVGTVASAVSGYSLIADILCILVESLRALNSIATPTPVASDPGTSDHPSEQQQPVGVDCDKQCLSVELASESPPAVSGDRKDVEQAAQMLVHHFRHRIASLCDEKGALALINFPAESLRSEVGLLTATVENPTEAPKVSAPPNELNAPVVVPECVVAAEEAVEPPREELQELTITVFPLVPHPPPMAPQSLVPQDADASLRLECSGRGGGALNGEPESGKRKSSDDETETLRIGAPMSTSSSWTLTA